jgi:argininosuccinate lyase
MKEYVMHDTGRITSILHPEARRIVFDADLQRAVIDDLPHYANIDRAQAVMLQNVGLLDRAIARRVFAELDRLQADGFRAIAQKPAPRGTYLAYEDYVRTTVGPEAGNLHFGRSRNDLNATVGKLKLRQPYAALAGELVDLLRTLCRRGREHLETVFPLHTHRQPAVPSTLAHHLAAFAVALSRDLEAVLALAPALNTSCLGAGVGGGTTLAILPGMTAQLLGFSAPPLNSIDCVASRDLVLRLLATSAILGSNLGRISETMLLWVGDAGLIALPDELVGSSSAMPHKRNAFLLEHVQGKAGAITGSLVAALTGMHATPFTNCVAVGTEAARQVSPGLSEAAAAVRLTRLCIDGMMVMEKPTADILQRGFINAMEAATLLAVDGSLDFRSAHIAVGRAVTQALVTGVGSLLGVSDLPGLTPHAQQLEPGMIARTARHGGGPAPEAVAAVLDELERQVGHAHAHLGELEYQWRRAHDELRDAITMLTTSAT